MCVCVCVNCYSTRIVLLCVGSKISSYRSKCINYKETK